MLLANNRFGARFATALVSVAAVIVGLPALLVAVALRRFDHLSPLTGMKAPWRWSVADLRSWAKHLTEGLDSSAALVDIFFRVALIIGWICVVVVVYTLVAETAFQVRHGMPSVGHRRLGGLGGLGMLGRKVAAVLVSVLPLAISVTPALAGSHVVGPVAAVVAHRAPDLDDPIKQTLTMPVEDPFATVSTLGAGWSVVEVKRGDSVWAIADRIAGERDVAIVAQQIVAANLGTMMSDGHRFSTPALIEPGWLLDVPVDAGSIVASTSPIQPTSVEASSPIQTDGVHVVVAGDSYWRIAEEQLDRPAADHEIALYTAELMSINAPLLGYADARLIRPGDTVALPTAEPSVTGASAVPDPRIDAPVAQPAPVPVAASAVLPPIVVSLPPPVDVEPVAVAVDGPTVASTPEVSTVDNRPNEGFPLSRGLAAAVLLSGGAIAALEARRRQQLRSAGVGARLLLPTGEAAKTEMLLRLLSAEDRLARLDLALRSAAPDLARQHARVLAAEVADDGEIRLYTDRPALSLASRWLLDVEEGTWRLPGDVTLAELAESGRGANQPCPAILHVGESAGGQLFVDLEAVGVLSVDAPSAVAASIVRCAVASLAVSPFAESSRVFTVGVGIEAHLGSPNFESTESLAAAADAVRATVGSITPATVGDVSTFGLRATACGGEAWEPTLLLAIGAEDRQGLEALLSLAGGGGRGVGVMVDRPIVGGGAVLRAVDGDFVLEPLGRYLTPVGLSTVDVAAVDDLLDAAERPLLVESDVDVDEAVVPTSPAPGRFADRPHRFVVQLLGPVAVMSAAGEPVAFDRSKAMELVVWLSQHRRRPTRTSARTALWDLAVRDATFSNVVSDARRALAKVVVPAAGQEWIGRTMNEELPLHDLVVSDAELLGDRVAAARGLETRAAIAVLRPAVEMLQGLPFAGTSYLWPDAEGITSSLILLATSAAGDLATHYLSIGDIDGVFWATGQGLKVLAGHEELIALRMRAHGLRGDLAGVRSEWDSYERAVNADTWAAAEPSPKLVDLRRELLAPSLAS